MNIVAENPGTEQTVDVTCVTPDGKKADGAYVVINN